MKRMTRLGSALLLSMALALAAAGCSDDRQPVAGDSIGTGDGGGSGTGDGGGSGSGDSGGGSALCPTALPASGGSCTSEGLVCQYGDDPRRGCRDKATCSAGSWQVTAAGCTTLPPVTCPATREAAAGQKCTPMDAYCSYDGDLSCHCTNCTEHPVQFCNGDPTWHCDAPNPDSACPAGTPNLGTACPTADQRCVYGCGSGGARTCKGGVWIESEGGPCPVSSRRLKKDIAYLDVNALGKLARRALSMRLATYRYKDPSYGAGPQLGFILEDVGKSFAGDPARGRVNLYGYASMLLATVQQQQRAIEALRREVRALRRSRSRRAP